MSLRGLHILITRPEPQGSALCQLLADQGADAYSIPSLEIKARPIKTSAFVADIAIFISANAVKHYPYAIFPSYLKYFAIGASTATALEQRGVIAEQPEKSDSEGLLLLLSLQKLKDQRIAIFCGVGGRLLLQETLISRGAHCERYEVYERRCALQEANRLQLLLKKTALNYVICTSGENLLCLETLAGSAIEQLHHFPLVVISKRIADIATARGFTQVLVMDNFIDNESIVRQLVKWKEST